MSDISNTLIDNTYYDFKDTQGRAQLSEIQSWIDEQEGGISTTKVGLQVDYQNKINTRLGLSALAIDPNTGLPFTFDSLSIYSNRRRCNVNDAGEITAWYGDEDYKENGSNGQVMVYQPKFYYRVEPVRLEEQSDGLGYHIRCANYWISETPITGFRVHPAFINEDGNEVDYYLIGAYEASIYDTSEQEYIQNDSYGDGTTRQVANYNEDLLSSIAGIKPASGLYHNLTRANCEQLAKNRGNVGWHNTTIQIESAEQLLMMIELGTMNFQNAIGAGVTSVADNSSMNCSAITGATSSLGNLTGRATTTQVTRSIDPETNMPIITTYTANGQVSISYRGRENPYGNIWKFVEGMIIAGRGESKGGIPFICNSFAFPETSSTTAGTGTHDFTLNGYTSAGFTITNTDGYISAMGYGNELYDWLFVASECSGNSTVPVGDYTYKTANLNGTRVALLGGFWTDGTAAGSFYWHLGVALTYRNRTVGGRAALIPRKLTRSILT